MTMLDLEHNKQLANDELAGTLSDVETIRLHGGEMLPYWYNALVSIKQGLDVQIQSKAADLAMSKVRCFRDGDKARYYAEEANFLGWKSRQRHFASRVQARLMHVKQMVREMRDRERASENADFTRWLCHTTGKTILEYREAVAGGSWIPGVGVEKVQRGWSDDRVTDEFDSR